MQIVAETNTDDTLKATYIYGTKRIYNEQNGEKTYYLYDAHGDTKQLTDSLGAELGIYSNKSGFMGKFDVESPIREHWLVDTSLAMKMTLTLKYKNGKTIFEYAPEEKQWWITGFNSRIQGVDPNDLIAYYTITFNSRGMYDSFYEKYSDDEYGWKFNPDTLTASYVF